MSNSSRAWLLQIPDKEVYHGITGTVADSLREANYFTKFYVATNRFLLPIDDCVHVHLKKDSGWSNNIIKALDSVEEDVFFMGCEDHLLLDFDAPLVELAYNMVESRHFGYVRLTRKSQIPTETDFGNVPAIDKSYRYYVSLQPSVWSKEYLKKVIRPNESSWQFEVLASQRAKELELPAGVTYKTAFNYKNLIEKGKLVDNPKTYTEIHG